MRLKKKEVPIEAYIGRNIIEKTQENREKGKGEQKGEAIIILIGERGANIFLLCDECDKHNGPCRRHLGH